MSLVPSLFRHLVLAVFCCIVLCSVDRGLGIYKSPRAKKYSSIEILQTSPIVKKGSGCSCGPDYAEELKIMQIDKRFHPPPPSPPPLPLPTHHQRGATVIFSSCYIHVVVWLVGHSIPGVVEIRGVVDQLHGVCA